MVLLTQLEQVNGPVVGSGRTWQPTTVGKWLVRLVMAAFAAGVLWLAPISTGSAQAQTPTTHVVQPGENLSSIAARYGVNYRQLANHNGIYNPNLLRVGQRLRIPAPTPTPTSVRSDTWIGDKDQSVSTPPVATATQATLPPNHVTQPTVKATRQPTSYAPTPTPTPTPRALLHTVRRSETLSVIARLYGVSVTEIKRWNGIKRDTIYAGQRLVIFIR